MPNTQFVKAAIISSHLPPAAAQANKIGISKIEHYVSLHGKDKHSPSIKDEFNDGRHSSSGKYMSSSDGEQVSDSESSKPLSGKPLSMYERISSMPNSSHTNVQNDDMLVQSSVPAIRSPGTNSRNVTPRDHLPCLKQSASVLSSQKRIEQPRQQQQQPTCNIKVERGAEVYDYLENRELQYYDDAANDSSVVSPTNDSHNRCALKRMCSEENLITMRNKKRSNDAYVSTNGNEVQQSGGSYVNCRTTFVAESSYPALTAEFNRYNDVNSQRLMIVESPNSSLHEVGVEYQQLVGDHPAAPLMITNPEEEQFSDLQDLKNDALLSPELDANPGTATVNCVLVRRWNEMLDFLTYIS